MFSIHTDEHRDRRAEMDVWSPDDAPRKLPDLRPLVLILSAPWLLFIAWLVVRFA